MSGPGASIELPPQGGKGGDLLSKSSIDDSSAFDLRAGADPTGQILHGTGTSEYDSMFQGPGFYEQYEGLQKNAPPHSTEVFSGNNGETGSTSNNTGGSSTGQHAIAAAQPMAAAGVTGGGPAQHGGMSSGQLAAMNTQMAAASRGGGGGGGGPGR